MKAPLQIMTAAKSRNTAEFLTLLPAKDTINTILDGKAANNCMSFVGRTKQEMDVMTKTSCYHKMNISHSSQTKVEMLLTADCLSAL
jgi:hypothetical protein